MFTSTLTTLAAVALSGVVAAAQQLPATSAPKSPEPAAAAARTTAQLVNIRLDLTITDQREGATSPPKVVTLLLGDRESGRLRTGQSEVNAKLDMDARPEILP